MMIVYSPNPIIGAVVLALVLGVERLMAPGGFRGPFDRLTRRNHFTDHLADVTGLASAI